MNLFGILWIFAVAVASIKGQTTTDSVPDIDITPVLVDGLVRGASEQNRQLFADPMVASALDLFRTTLGEIVTYNLNVTDKILYTPANCTRQLIQRTRVILDSTRDRAFACLQTYRTDLNAFVNYSFCLFDVEPMAKAEIDAVKPSIDSCAATIAASSVSGTSNSTTTG